METNKEKVKLDDELLDQVTGGAGGSGYELTVCGADFDGGGLGLWPYSYKDPNQEVVIISPGSQLFTYGEINSGYIRVQYHGVWGWVNASCVS